MRVGKVGQVLHRSTGSVREGSPNACCTVASDVESVRAFVRTEGLAHAVEDYARDRQATASHAMARKILTDAGISWESL